MKTLIIVDWHNLLHKWHFSQEDLANSKGFPTWAIYWALNIIMPRVIREFNPSNMIFVFDNKTSKQQRTEIANDYKWTRDNTWKEGLFAQIDLTQELLWHTEHDTITVQRFEADDIIASIAKRYEKEWDFDRVLIFSSDNDFLWLVNDKIKLLKKVHKWDYFLYWVEDFLRDFEWITQEQFYDYKSIVWDWTDNIQWFKKMWHSAAMKILLEFKSVENFINSWRMLQFMSKHYRDIYNWDEEKCKNEIWECLRKNQKLAYPMLDNKVVETFRFFNKKRNEEKVKEIISDLEFRTLWI